MQKTWKEEERIPSVRELSSMLEVNANTVMRAYESLQEDAIVYNQRGIGYFVSPNAGAKINKLFRKEFFEEDLPQIFEKMKLLGISIEEISAAYINKYK